MAVFLGISCVVLLLPHEHLLKLLADQTISIHHLCLDTTPTGSYKEFYDAIVCGAPLNGSRAQAFRSTGLIHLIVVSGTHLIFLSTIIEFVFPNKWFQFGTLSLFVMMTGWQPPALRALASLLLTNVSRRFGLAWSPIQVCLASGMLTWSLFPELIVSLSFLLSWAAALSLTTTRLRGLARHAVVFVLLFPILAPICAPHPASIILNWIFVPIVGGILFPLSLVATAAHSLQFIPDALWGALEWILSQISSELTLLAPGVIASQVWLWIYVWGIHFLAHANKVGRRNV